MAERGELKRLHVIHKILDRELKEIKAKAVLNLRARLIREMHRLRT